MHAFDQFGGLGDEAIRALRALVERAMDGYTLSSLTGLEPEALRDAVSQLLDQGLIDVKGGDFGDIRESYLVVPPDKKGLAMMALARFPRPRVSKLKTP